MYQVIVTHDGNKYRATILGGLHLVLISRQENGNWVSIGDGEFSETGITNCSAVMSQEVYDSLNKELFEKIRNNDVS